MTYESEKLMAELDAQGVYPAYAAVTIAKEFGFNNVVAEDDGNVEFAGDVIVASISVSWLDCCRNETPALALLAIDVDRHADFESYESVSACLADMAFDMQRLEDFASLFVY